MRCLASNKLLGSFAVFMGENRDKQQPASFRWRKPIAGFALFLAAVAVDWIIFEPRSTQCQRKTEQVLSAFPLPPATSQIGYESFYLPHRGYAEKTLVSAASPQEVCNFYLPTLQDEGWIFEEQDCLSTPNHRLLAFRKGNAFCTIRVGHRDSQNTYYIRLGWAGW